MNIQYAPRYQGKLMSTVDGGYPVLYLTVLSNLQIDSTYCTDCANAEEASGTDVTDFDIFYEGAPVECDVCGASIASAYGDPDADRTCSACDSECGGH